MKPVRTALAAALTLAAMPAFAQTYSQTIFFGDSLTDAGTFRPALVQVVGPNGAILGKFTTNPALVWAEYLAQYYSTNATPSNQGGTNFAVGGARVTTNGNQAFSPTVIVPIPSLQTQVNTYLAANGGKADAKALYTVWGGANDIFAIAAGAPAAATLGGAVAGQIGIVSQLTAAGARYIIVPTLPDMGQTPAARVQGATAQAQFTGLATTYNTNLFNGLAAANLRVIPLDTFHLLNEVIANPAEFGITVTNTGTACNPQFTASSLTCNPTTYATPTAPQTYLFADGVHPSAAGHEILADYAISILEAPRQVQLLLNSTAVSNRARTEVVARQANAGALADGEGMRWWANVRGDYQRYGKGGLYDGHGPALTAGVDWKAGSVVFGGYGGFGRSSFESSRGMGEFDQHDATLGAYLGWRSGAAWANGQLSYSRTSYDLDRRVELGRATRNHHGETDGNVLSLGAEGGWEFGSGSVRHGPIVGVLAQRVDIDGFAEDQATLSTSLAYPEQNFDSLIGKVGWQGRVEGAGVNPYARFTVDREFEDMPEEAFARAQTLSTTGDYAVPGVRFDTSYATLQFGARSKLFGLDADAGASVTFMQDSRDATVYFTLGSGF